MIARWNRKLLSEVIDVKSGQVDPTTLPYAKMPHVGGDNIESGTGRFLGIRTAEQLGFTSGKYFFTEDDILYSKIRPNLNKVAVPTFEGICSADIYPLRPKNGLIVGEFLAYLLRSSQFLAYAEKHSTRTNIPKLNRNTLLAYEVELPPLSEQKRIAEILDRAEALRAKRRTALALLDELTQSIFLDMFGDVVSNERNWPTERMEQLMTIRRGGSPRPIEKFLGGTVNWIKIGDGTKGSDIYLESCVEKIKESGLAKTVFLKSGSLIFANCGVSLGFARILKIDGCIHDGWLSFADVPEERLNKLFLLKALNSITDHFRRIAPAGTQPNLNTGLMKNFKMIVPDIELQQLFERRLLEVESIKSKERDALLKSDQLFASLQHRAFRGEL